MEHPLPKKNMDAPDMLPENGRRGSLNRVGGSTKQKAQMKAALQSGIHSFHRPVTRSQAKLFSNTSMFPEEVSQEMPTSEGDVLSNGSEQIPDMDLGPFLANDSKKMMLGGGSSVETMQVESFGENPDWLPTHSNLEESDITSGTQIKVQAMFNNISMFPEEVAQRKPNSEGDVLSNGSEQIPDMDLAPFLVNDSKKMMLGGGSSVETMQAESFGQPTPGCLGPFLVSDSKKTSLLHTIYTKYGNITQGCESEAFKKISLLAICEAIQKLQVTCINDISSDDVAELYSLVKDAGNVKLNVEWLHQRLVEIEESLRSRDKLKTMEEAQKAITLKVENLQKCLAMNKLKIARLEHESEVLREEQTVKKFRCEEVKALTEDIKSSYHSCPKYLIDCLY